MKPLTKSRFRLGLECPNKLFFTGKKEYASKKIDDPFLEALAKGGFQVEALARFSYPKGVFVEAENWDYEGAAQITMDAFAQENTCLFEAAFAAGNLFVRSDIVEKNGSEVKLIEVKAKSGDSTDPNIFFGVRGGMNLGWIPYLYDLAFQKYVAQKAFPNLKFSAFLMLADKSKKATVNGLNQMFRIHRDADPRKEIDIRVDSANELGDSVLCEIDVNEIINEILAGNYPIFPEKSFEETVEFLEKLWMNDRYSNWSTSLSSCKNCEFKATKEEEEAGLQSGFKYCFTKQFGWSEIDFVKPTVLDVWDLRNHDLFESGLLHMEQITEEHLQVKSEPGRISRTERQWLQIQKAVTQDKDVEVLKEELKYEMDKWKFPLHFIDFETSTVAIPFTSGRKPYEQTAFQFSHHLYYEDGTVQHHSEYLNDNPGLFPNFDFARALKTALQNDDGTIFKYSPHENTILNAIIRQLNDSNEPDKESLISFFRTITNEKAKNKLIWKGERDMVDLLEVVKKYYYNPLTNGSNSLKFVLPAALNSSSFLKQKYSQPLREINLTSRNFPDSQVWLKEENGVVINPYKQLPKLFEEWDAEKIEETISELDSVADGGAALTAYSKLQFTDMSDEERIVLRSGLLKYCELDTLAMVMLYEHFRYDF